MFAFVFNTWIFGLYIWLNLKMLERKKEFEAILAKKSNDAPYWECTNPNCRVRTRNDKGEWCVENKSFSDESRYRMHMQLHINDKRAAVEVSI
jgi:hypothetical protein